jgi:hypothetical protein
VIERARLKRHRAIVEDLAYGGLSRQQIADKYGMEPEAVDYFAASCAGVIRMARWERYRELQHRMLMAEIIELVGRDALLGALVTAQEMSPYRGSPELN